MAHRHWRQGVFQPATLFAGVALLLILFVTAAFFFWLPHLGQAAQPSQLLDELVANQQTWEQQRPVSFRYRVKRTCFCGPEATTPYVATEQRGQKSAEFLVPLDFGGGDPLAGPLRPEWIDGIFAEIDKGIRNDATVEVMYDRRYGFPVSASIRYPIPDAYMHYELNDFEALED